MELIYETKKFQKIKSNYNPDEKYSCEKYKKKKTRPITNKRFNKEHNKFNHIFFTAGDLIDIERYGLFPIRVLFDKVSKKVNIKKNVYKDLKFKMPSLYKSFDLNDIENTFKYIYKKFQKGILVAIKDNKLVVYLPFFNSKFSNDYFNLMYLNDNDKKDLEKMKEILQSVDFDINKLSLEKKNLYHKLKYITNQNLIDYYKNYRSGYRNYIKDRSKWLANDYVFQEHPDNDMKHGVSEYEYLLLEVLKNRKIPDCIFFISYRDIPILKNDKTEPYEILYGKNIKFSKECNNINFVPIFFQTF